MQTVPTRLAAAAATSTALSVLAGRGGGSGTKTASSTTSPARAAATTAAAATTDTAPDPSTGSVSATGPCSLLTDAEVARLAPGVEHGKLDKVGGARICDWPDANGIPAVQIQAYPAPASSLRNELKTIGAYGGYTIIDVAGLGDEAAAAFQKPDASKRLTAGLAALAARRAGRVIGLRTPRIDVRQGSPAFALVETLAAKTLARLKAAG